MTSFGGTTLRRPVALALAATAAVSALALAAPGAGATTLAFTEPAQLPARGSIARETSIDVGPDGVAHAVTLTPEGTQRFRSADGGLTFSYNGTLGTSGFGGGRDADVAISPEPNASGHHTIWMLDLWQASISLEVSTDGGASWEVNPAIAQIPWSQAIIQPGALPLNERPWIVAEGHSVAYVSYVATGLYMMRCVAEPAPSCGPPALVMDIGPHGSGFGLYPTFWPGGLTIDRADGTLYMPFLGSGPAGPLTQVWIAVSRDGARTFRNMLVHEDPSGAPLNNFFPIPAVDTSGNVYVAWSDDRRILMSASTDGGSSWSDAYVVSRPPSDLARSPWIAAGSEGNVDVVWYGADQTGVWYAYLALVRGSIVDGEISAAPFVEQVRLREEPVFQGVLGRALLDFFEVAIDPSDGAAVTAFTSDRGGARTWTIRQCGGSSAFEGASVSPCT